MSRFRDLSPVLPSGLIVGALAGGIRFFGGTLIFVVVWFTLSYIPIARMWWGGGLRWLLTARWILPVMVRWCILTPYRRAGESLFNWQTRRLWERSI